MKSKNFFAVIPLSFVLIGCGNKYDSAANLSKSNIFNSAQMTGMASSQELKNTRYKRSPSSTTSNQPNATASPVLESEESCVVPTYAGGVAPQNGENATYGQCQIKIRFSNAASAGIIIIGGYSIEISASNSREAVVDVGDGGLDLMYYANKYSDKLTEKKSLRSLCGSGAVRDVRGRCGLIASANPQNKFLKVDSATCAGWIYNKNAGDICNYTINYDVSGLQPENNGLKDVFRMTYAMIDANGALGFFATGVEVNGKGSITSEPFYRMHYSIDAARKWVLFRNDRVIDELIISAPANSNTTAQSISSR